MSEIKVNKISPRTNCGTTQLGDSGDTFNLPSGGTLTIASGATITNNGTANNFGATGSVNWQTTVKTSGFTAVNGEGYFVDTTSGPITVILPTGSAGAVIGFSDYAQTFDTNAVTLDLAGSDKAAGSTSNPTLTTEGQAVTLVFVDSTKGWIVTDSGLQSDAQAAEYVVATGGTITNSPCGNFKIHKFTGPGTFCVSAAGNSSGSNSVDYLVVAGGGAGGYSNGGGGGGGAGGLRYSACTYCNPTPSGGLASTALPVTVTGYPVTVGAGGGARSGSPEYKRGCNGSNSVFTGSTTITSAGGGGGGGGDTPPTGTAAGNSGGSGGGGGKTGAPGCGVAAAGGAGNTPSVSPSQGNDGGTGGVPNPNFGGGGGGHAAAGQNASAPSNDGGDGGNGSVIKIDDTCAAYAGGGGGQAEGQPGPAQGQGGSGGGGTAAQTGSNGNAGSANTGGGGGGADSSPAGQQSGAGGSGIVIIRYKFQN